MKRHEKKIQKFDSHVSPRDSNKDKEYTKDETIFSCFKQSKKDITKFFVEHILLILNENLVFLIYVEQKTFHCNLFFNLCFLLSYLLFSVLKYGTHTQLTVAATLIYQFWISSACPRATQMD